MTKTVFFNESRSAVRVESPEQEDQIKVKTSNCDK